MKKPHYIAFRTTDAVQALIREAAEKESRTVSGYLHAFFEEKLRKSSGRGPSDGTPQPGRAGP